MLPIDFVLKIKEIFPNKTVSNMFVIFLKLPIEPSVN